MDQEEPAARQGERRHLQRVVQLPRQQRGPRGDALGVPVPRHRRGAGHGHRERGHARGVRGDQARAPHPGGGRAAQPPARRHRAPGRLRREAQGPELGRDHHREARGGVAQGHRGGAPLARAREGHRHLHRRRYAGSVHQAGAPAPGHRGAADGRHECGRRSLRSRQDVPPAGREVGPRDEEGRGVPDAVHGGGEAARRRRPGSPCARRARSCSPR